MRYLIIFILFALPESAWSQNCYNKSNSKIKISKKIADIKTYSDLSVANFNDVSNPHHTKLVMGLTIGKITLSSNFKIKLINQKDKFCANLEQIDINYALDSLDVYLPNDFAPGSCRYEEVRKHEYQHVKIYTDTYNQYYLKLKKIVNTKLTNSFNDAILVNNTKEAEQIYKEELSAILTEFNNKLEKDLNNKHKKIDTEENYKAIAAKCKNWEVIKLEN